MQPPPDTLFLITGCHSNNNKLNYLHPLLFLTFHLMPRACLAGSDGGLAGETRTGREEDFLRRDSSVPVLKWVATVGQEYELSGHCGEGILNYWQQCFVS